MNRKKKLYILWAALYGGCALLSLIPAPGSLLAATAFLLSLSFFAPGAVLLYQAIRRSDRKTVQRIRYLALAWLITTAVLLVLNVLSATASSAWGNLLYYCLAVICAPLVSSQNWLLPVFLWGCLLFASFTKLPKAEEQTSKATTKGKKRPR